MPQFGHAGDAPPPSLHDRVSGTQPCPRRWRTGPAGGHRRCGREGVAGRIANPQNSRAERLPLLQPRQHPQQILQGHGEADP